ncbi:MAG: hypothetical protein DRJ10_13155 [Bacteroidetes bacterium]|nr:MAG: hypothetical protein DRJ10_13155 [Bacteroidota bacterium]
MKPKYNYHYNMIKGRVAEAIIKELFQVNGYRVYDYGMERTLPQAIENGKNLKDEMAYRVRNMPDFLVQDIKSGVLNYVEVKYRVKGSFTLKDIENNPYETTCFIIVSKENIQWISFAELTEGKILPASNEKNIENNTKFHLKNELISEYKAYAKAFFEGVK